MRIGKGRAKALLGIAMAVVMSISLMPAASALALGDLQTWAPPTSKSATSYVENGKTYKYITSSARKVSESTADVLGISNVTVCPTAGNPFTYSGSADDIYASISTNARFGIYGSEVNQNMNPYYANYFYNQYQQTSAVSGSDLADTRDTVLVDQRLNPGAPSGALTNIATEYGTSPVLYYRPDILYGVTSLTDKNDTSINLSYGTATTSISGYSELVDKIRNKELGEYEGVSLYQEGDENYDPYYVMYDMTSYTASIVDNLYSLANAAENIIQSTANTDNPKVTRYEDPMQIASDYEAYLRGTQYAVLAAIADKKVERKTIGIVEAANATENTITFMPCDVQGKDTHDYAEFLEAVTDNICDKNGLSQNGNVGTAQDLLDCDVVYIYGFNGTGSSTSADGLKDAIITILKNAGYTDESQYPEINVQAPKTVIHHDRGGSVENTVLLGALIGYAYPEVINPVYALAYFYENFYHIKDSRLQDALGMNLAAMSLPAGIELSLEGYNEVDYLNILGRGVGYYFANKETIDAAYPKLTATENLVLLGLDAHGFEGVYDGQSHAVVATPSRLDGTVVEYQVDNSGTWTTEVPSITNCGTMNVAVRATNPEYGTVTVNVVLKVTPKVQTITANDVTETFGAKPFSLNAKTDGDGALSYASSDAKVATVSADGKVAIKGAGVAKITVNAAATANCEAGSKTVTVTVNKAKNPVTLAKKKIKAKSSKLKKAYAINKAKKAQGKVTYSITKAVKGKKNFKSKFSINKSSGKISIKKGIAKGTYKVTVKASAKGNANYEAGFKTAVVTVKVK